MAKLTITFEDTDIGFAFYPDAALQAAGERVKGGAPDITNAEAVAVMAFFTIQDQLAQIVEVLGAKGLPLRMVQAGGGTVEESVEEAKRLIAEEDECGGDCAHCTHCSGNKTIH